MRPPVEGGRVVARYLVHPLLLMPRSAVCDVQEKETFMIASSAPDFRAITAQVAPHPDELRWQAIPWEVDFW